MRAAAGEAVATVHVGPAVYPVADPPVACATVNDEKYPVSVIAETLIFALTDTFTLLYAVVDVDMGEHHVM